MIKSLYIRNFALIEDLTIDFQSGFNIITGETGAGKSILLGALGLILGNRADLNSVKDSTKKCIVEGLFSLSEDMKSSFESLNIDFEKETIIRRELLPSGKSRSFVNDSPVKLSALQELKNLLIDVHSQHQSLEINSKDFQYDLIDLVAGQTDLRKDYHKQWVKYELLKKEKETLLNEQRTASTQHDYNLFLLEELEKVDLDSINVEDLETKQELLSNGEEIQLELSQAQNLLDDDIQGVLTNLSQVRQSLSKISAFGDKLESFDTRVESSHIELTDLLLDLSSYLENMESNPQELEEINNVLSTIFDLKKKHGLIEFEDLILKREELRGSVARVDEFDQRLKELKDKLEESLSVLEIQSKTLGENRRKSSKSLKEKLKSLVAPLGMNDAGFEIDLEFDREFNKYGNDRLSLLFSANKGMEFGPLNKRASGGELSRVMLAIKMILAEYSNLPSLIFDEIDTGVSGEVALKMGHMMEEIANNIQVIAISHLPQVAALGSSHLKVFKTDNSIGGTSTFVKSLDRESRILELAEMLGGKSYSESAINHAKDLLLD
jgi:DNA repair protein RecN (Recombination protein N)